VERYDRFVEDGKIIRLHQEDFCQACGALPFQKYEQQGGIITSKYVISIISKFSSNSREDIETFVKSLFIDYLIGNPNGHGKNYSFILKNNCIRLAPLYDISCFAVMNENEQEI
jgi:serine/threonine-protein kinase HipA